MDKEKLKIGIVGHTGLVGQELKSILTYSGYDPDNFVLMNSSHPKTDHYMDVVFMAATDEVSRDIVPYFVDRGSLVIDDSAAFRMYDSVPLVIPEINGDEVHKHTGVISTPNCAVVPVALGLAAIKPKDNEIKSVRVTTFQSVSGAGRSALNNLRNQKGNMYDNVIPEVGGWDDLKIGYTGEEIKIENELQKIFDAGFLVSATCVRVPVEIGHCASVHVEFEDIIGKIDLAHTNHVNGVSLMIAPTVYDTTKFKDEVLLGRIRNDLCDMQYSALFWVATNNLRKGAALNSVQIMEAALKGE